MVVASLSTSSLLASCSESEGEAQVSSTGSSDDQSMAIEGPLRIAVRELRLATELPEEMGGFGPNPGASYAAVDIEISNTSNSTERFTALNVTFTAASGQSLVWQTFDMGLVTATEIAGHAALAARVYIEIPDGETLASFVFDPLGHAATIRLDGI